MIRVVIPCNPPLNAIVTWEPLPSVFVPRVGVGSLRRFQFGDGTASKDLAKD